MKTCCVLFIAIILFSACQEKNVYERVTIIRKISIEEMHPPLLLARPLAAKQLLDGSCYVLVEASDHYQYVVVNPKCEYPNRATVRVSVDTSGNKFPVILHRVK